MAVVVVTAAASVAVGASHAGSTFRSSKYEDPSSKFGRASPLRTSNLVIQSAISSFSLDPLRLSLSPVFERSLRARDNPCDIGILTVDGRDARTILLFQPSSGLLLTMFLFRALPCALVLSWSGLLHSCLQSA